MPHVSVKLWPGKTGQQKKQLADEITRSIMKTVNCGAESVSVGFVEIQPGDWAEKVYRPEIEANPETLYKKPGYTM